MANWDRITNIRDWWTIDDNKIIDVFKFSNKVFKGIGT